KKRGQYWLVENLEKPSGIFDEAFEKLIPQIKAWCEASGLEVYNQKTHEGFWRNLLVRKSFAEDKLLICMVVSQSTSDNIQYTILQHEFLKLLQEALGDRVKGVFWQTSKSVSDSVRNHETRKLLFGEMILVEKINNLEFEISLESFFQTNPQSAEKLYDKVVEYIESGLKSRGDDLRPDSAPLVLDLFCGTGTIGQIIKHQMPNTRVIGVEILEEAIKDAKANAKRNDLNDLKFFSGDVGKFLKAHPEYEGKIDTVVLDPPRAGIAPKTLRKVLDLGAQTMIYISCNPSTMARDTVTLKEAGYKLEKLSMVDQFPHTAHVECVGRFILSCGIYFSILNIFQIFKSGYKTLKQVQGDNHLMFVIGTLELL
ncbi:MAG TPA: 23S rRNA (uracil(1939)-C(5))-methyltransferase RlmD, partial [Candidatus Gracilibacteria bacterium]